MTHERAARVRRCRPAAAGDRPFEVSGWTFDEVDDARADAEELGLDRLVITRLRNRLVNISELSTPALLIDADALDHNLAAMAAVHPGSRLRPHVKAHKCTSLAAAQDAYGHHAFTCATPREVVGMAAAGLGDDLLLANEMLDPVRLGAMAAAQDGTITVAVDSTETVDAAAAAGIEHVLIDVNVGLPRCGCEPGDAGALADQAARPRARRPRRDGLRGPPHGDRRPRRAARQGRRGDGQAAGGQLAASAATSSAPAAPAPTTCTIRSPRSRPARYALMDTALRRARPPVPAGLLRARHRDLRQRRVGRRRRRAEDAGHGPRQAVDRRSQRAVPAPTSTSRSRRRRGRQLGDRVQVIPAHIDPTMAMHEAAFVVRGDEVIDRWPIDLRGW